jgi:DNA (cytosine-5)-methyltransferase 1
MRFKFVDLFAGIGGFHIGLKSVGGECVFANEWDRHAAATYHAWTGHEPNQVDIRELDPKLDFPDHDVLSAGFPCQPFSLAGVSKKNSLGRDHGFNDVHQGNLFFSICGVIEHKKPKIVFLENVKNLLSHDRGNTWSVIRSSLESLGYHVTWRIIDAKHWVPQHRERIFVVAFRDDLFSVLDVGQFGFGGQYPLSSPKLKTILEAHPNPNLMLSPKLWEYLQEYSRKHKANGNGFGYSIANRDGISRTLSARYYKDGSEILIQETDWERPRRLSVREARKLMGFTAGIARLAGISGTYPQVVSDQQAYKQFGNSVSPLVVRAVALEIVSFLEP